MESSIGAIGVSARKGPVIGVAPTTVSAFNSDSSGGGTDALPEEEELGNRGFTEEDELPWNCARPLSFFA